MPALVSLCFWTLIDQRLQVVTSTATASLTARLRLYGHPLTNNFDDLTLTHRNHVLYIDPRSMVTGLVKSDYPRAAKKPRR